MSIQDYYYALLGAASQNSGTPSGSFFTAPLRIVDQEHHATGSTAMDIDFRFYTTGSSPANQLQQKNEDNTVTAVPNQSQWKTDTNGTPAYSIRHTTLTGDGSPVFDFPTIDVWASMANPATFGMNRPAAGSTHITFTVEIAETADTTTVLARATLTLRYTRA